jgi:hypothetical protein
MFLERLADMMLCRGEVRVLCGVNVHFKLLGESHSHDASQLSADIRLRPEFTSGEREGADLPYKIVSSRLTRKE